MMVAEILNLAISINKTTHLA